MLMMNAISLKLDLLFILNIMFTYIIQIYNNLNISKYALKNALK